MAADPLAGLADDPALTGLWADAHERWCENGGCRGSLTIRPAEVTAVRRLLGGRLGLSVTTVKMTRIAECLHGEDRLATVLTHAVGPLEDRRSERRAVIEARGLRQAERLAAWNRAAVGLAAVVRSNAEVRPAGLPELPARFAPVLTAACAQEPGPDWRTFADAGVREGSAAHNLALRLVGGAHPGVDAVQRLALCRHQAEAAARNLDATEQIVEFCRDHGGRSPLKMLGVDQLHAVVGLLADLARDAFLRERPVLAVLARERFDDPHALDRGEPAGQAAIRFLAARAGITAPTTADRWRDAWEQAGVEPDRVSSRVLVCGLRPAEQYHSLSTLLDVAAERGDELSLGLRQLSDGLPHMHCRRALVVENPPVFESLMNGLPDTVALVCCEGVPTAAARHLVRGLVGDGVRVGVSADDDKGGLTIKAVLAAEGAEPLAPRTRWEEASVDVLRSWLLDGLSDNSGLQEPRRGENREPIRGAEIQHPPA